MVVFKNEIKFDYKDERRSTPGGRKGRKKDIRLANGRMKQLVEDEEREYFQMERRDLEYITARTQLPITFLDPESTISSSAYRAR